MKRDSIWTIIDDRIGFSILQIRVSRFFRKWYQRIFWGFSDEETWNMDEQFCKFMLPRLKRFKKLNNGFPGGLTPEKWDTILDKMILSCEIVLREDALNIKYGFFKLTDKDREKLRKQADEGFKLLGEFIRHLWW